MFKRELPLPTNSTTGARRSASPAPSSIASPQSPSLPSLEDIDQKFVDAEIDRRRAFEESTAQQKLAFLQLITAQHEVENQRDDQFTKLLIAVRLVYTENRSERDKRFQKSQDKHTNVLAARETSRDAVFQAAQAARGASFRQSQDQRLQRAEWYAQQRDRLLEQGRDQRNKVGDRLVSTISMQFNALIVDEESAFLAAEQSYDAQVKEQILQVGSQNLHSSCVLNICGHAE